MRAVRSVARASAVLLALVLTGGCDATGLPSAEPSATYPLPPPPTVLRSVTPATDQSTLPPIAPLPVPDRPYPVSRRTLDLSNGDRPLRTLVLFPASEYVDGTFNVAPGAFPLVLFSHGLRGDPARYESDLTPIAAAGFVVVAPTYPGTSADAEDYDPLDVLNQPADASAVISAVLALAEDPADRLFGHIDEERVGSIGHSAGGYTTVGLLTNDRDERIRSAVVLAGSGLSNAFQGPPAALLFVHGQEDAVVPYEYGRTTYAQVPWPKAFLTVVGGDHANFLTRSSPAFGAVNATVLDFLRATLYGDPDAFGRIPGEATVPGTTRFESTIVFPPAPSTTAAPSASASASATPSPSATPNHP